MLFCRVAMPFMLAAIYAADAVLRYAAAPMVFTYVFIFFAFVLSRRHAADAFLPVF